MKSLDEENNNDKAIRIVETSNSEAKGNKFNLQTDLIKETKTTSGFPPPPNSQLRLPAQKSLSKATFAFSVLI